MRRCDSTALFIDLLSNWSHLAIGCASLGNPQDRRNRLPILTEGSAAHAPLRRRHRPSHSHSTSHARGNALVNYEPAMEGPDGRTIPLGDAAATQWPVLARLPDVAADAEQAGSQTWTINARLSPTEAAGPPRVNPPLRITGDADDYGPLSYEQVGYGENAPRPCEPRYRIDAGQPRGSFRHAAAPTASLYKETQTIAAKVFQWHAAAAPYAGLAMTFVLAMFAGLLYWSTFARPAAPASAPVAAPEWGANLAATPSASRPLWSAPAPRYDTPESPLSRTPRIQLDLPPLAEMTAEAAPAEDVSVEPIEVEPALGVLSEEAKPGEEAADPADEAAIAEPQLTTTSDGTAPTPISPETAPLTASYPTTPFASFDFGPAAHQAAAQVESPASAAPR